MIVGLSVKAQSLRSGLVLYLPFSGHCYDMSGYGNHGILHNGTYLTTDEAGKANSAYFFDGLDDYITVPDATSLSPQQFTLCAKVFPTGFYLGTCYKNSVINKSDPDWVTGQYCLRFDNNFKYASSSTLMSTDCTILDTNNQVFNGYCYNAYPTVGYFASSPRVHTGQWYCAVLTADLDSIKMYVNGVKAYAYKRSGTQGVNTEDVWIGKMQDKIYPLYPYYFKGKLDEIRIYNRALTPTEVSAYCSYVAPANDINVDFKDSATSCLNRSFKDLTTTTGVGILLWRWDFGDGGKSSLQNPSHAFPAMGSYNVKLVVIDSNGLSDSVTKTIWVNKFAKASNDTSICLNNGIGKVDLTASGGTSYLWSPSTGLSSTTTATTTATVTSNVTYVVTVTDALGCTDTDTVKIYTLPGAIVNAGTDTAACIGSVIQLKATGAISYLWTPSTGLNNANIPNPVLTVWGKQDYVVRGTNSYGCYAYDTLKIDIVAVVSGVVATPQDTLVCRGAIINLAATGAVTYKWTPPTGLSSDIIANPTLTVSMPGSYIVSGKDNDGCLSFDTVNINLYPQPNVVASMDGTGVSCTNNSVKLNATGAKTYTWSPGAYCDDNTIANPRVYPPSTTVFTVIGIDSNGCMGMDTVTVNYDNNTVVRIPNAFTPNNDGINDRIFPIIVCDYELRDFRIFSRWGQEVFSTNSPAIGWDGSFKGVPLDAGVYFYMLRGKNKSGDEVMFKGEITMIR